MCWRQLRHAAVNVFDFGYVEPRTPGARPCGAPVRWRSQPECDEPSGDVGSTSASSFADTLDSGTLVTDGEKTGKVCSNNTEAKGQYVFIL
jgi:hypothetical protein